jgi:hypothetical protein
MIDPINPAAVIPAKAGIQFQATAAALEQNWIPAFAGMTPGQRLRKPTPTPPMRDQFTDTPAHRPN